MDTSTYRITVYLSTQLIQRLKIYAIQQNKSASAIAAEAIEEYLLYREPPEPTPPAPAKLNGKKEGAAA